PEHRLLFGHHPQGDGLPDLDVHGAVRGRPHGRLDRAVEGNDRRPEPEDRPPAAALHRGDRARLSADLAPQVGGPPVESRADGAFTTPRASAPWRGSPTRSGATTGATAGRPRAASTRCRSRPGRPVRSAAAP